MKLSLNPIYDEALFRFSSVYFSIPQTFRFYRAIIVLSLLKDLPEFLRVILGF
jgi:hypothetical protein